MIIHVDGCYSPYYKDTEELIERLKELIKTGFVVSDKMELEQAVGDALTWIEMHSGLGW